MICMSNNICTGNNKIILNSKSHIQIIYSLTKDVQNYWIVISQLNWLHNYLVTDVINTADVSSEQCCWEQQTDRQKDIHENYWVIVWMDRSMGEVINERERIVHREIVKSVHNAVCTIKVTLNSIELSVERWLWGVR